MRREHLCQHAPALCIDDRGRPAGFAQGRCIEYLEPALDDSTGLSWKSAVEIALFEASHSSNSIDQNDTIIAALTGFHHDWY